MPGATDFAARLQAILHRHRPTAASTTIDQARRTFGACLADAIDAALAESAGVEARFETLMPLIRREMSTLASRLEAELAGPTAFGRWAAEMLDGALAAGRKGARDPRLETFAHDPYAKWRRRLGRVQWVLAAIALVALIAYLSSRG